ncbi:alcohol dehydrogenase [Planctomycetota bacterium]|nr:alcohol dehydrogenase [Planctomycetota bacterium]
MRVDRIRFTARDQVETDQINLDPAPGPGQVLIKSRMTMVSQGTEMAALRGTHTRSNLAEPPVWLRYPSVPGYLQVGVIEAVGAGVTGFAVGERVIGEGPGCWNTHQSHLVQAADPRWLVKVPAGVDDRAAVMAKLASVATHGLRTVDPLIGESCAVIGLGMVGQLASRLAVLTGMRVTACDPVPARRAIASGVPHLTVVAPEELPVGDPAGFEHVIEASGAPAGFLAACTVARRLGRISVVSSPHRPVEIRLYEHVHSKCLQVHGAHGSSMAVDPTAADRWTERRQKELFLALVAAGRIDVSPLITHVHAWHEAPQVYRRLIDDPSAFLGVVFTWN